MFEKLDNFLAPRNLAALTGIALIYCLAGKLGLRVAFVHPYVTPIWVSSGIAITAFILFGYRVWPAILLGGFFDHLTTDGFVIASFTIPVIATLEGLAGAYLVNKYAHGAKTFDTARDVFCFVFFACICAPLISATLGASMEHLRGVSVPDLAPRWLAWWLAYGVGTLLVSPFLILLLRASHHRLNLREFGELALLLVGLIFVCLLVFGPLSLSLNKSGALRAFLCVPFLLWAAFRFCQLEAAGATLIVFGAAIWGTLHGYGSFVAKDLATSLVALDTFIGVIGTMTLVVAAMVAERRRIESELLGTQSLLQEVLKRKERDLVVTVQALDVEAASHAQTNRAFQENQGRSRRLGERTKPEEKRQ